MTSTSRIAESDPRFGTTDLQSDSAALCEPRPCGPSLPNLVRIGGSRPDSAAFDISDSALPDALRESEPRHFWFAGRNRVILAAIKRLGLRPPARIMDIGCGSGMVLQALLRAGYRADGIEMHAPLCERAADACPRATIHQMDVLRHEMSSLHGRYAAVGMFDVLEHIADPTAILRDAARYTKDEGLILGTVPALSGLWSRLDELVGHRRRYNRQTLGAELVHAGLRPVRIDYFFQSLVFPIWLHRHLGRNAPVDAPQARRVFLRRALAVPAPAVNTAFRAICAAERACGRLLPLRRLPGASLFFAARVDRTDANANRRDSTVSGRGQHDRPSR
jgi:SAM-dependent methyltransferase